MGPAGAGRPGRDGAGRRSRGRRHHDRRPGCRSRGGGKGTPWAARRVTAVVRWGARAPAWLGHRLAPLRAPRAPRARFGARGRGRGRAGRGRTGAGRGLGPRLQPAPETLGGRWDLQEVCGDARGRRSTCGAHCPKGAKANLLLWTRAALSPPNSVPSARTGTEPAVSATFHAGRLSASPQPKHSQ